MADREAEDAVVEMHAIVHGEVQGVFFRATTRDFAERMGITGTVRNVPDGTVEIFAQGTRADLARLLEKLTGPSGPGAVREIEKEFYPPPRTFDGFRVMR